MASRESPLGDSIEGNEEIFEIEDFTTVTELECFAASLETVIHDWKLGGVNTEGIRRKTSDKASLKDFHKCKFGRRNEKISYGSKMEFFLTHYYPEREVLSKENEGEGHDDELGHLHVAARDLLTQESDFCAANVITAQFGVYEFLVLIPVSDNTDCVDNEDFLNMLLSGISIAQLNSNCHLPIFVQYGPITRYLYAGISQNRNSCIEFEASHLKQGLPKHKYLSGIIDMFKEKVNCPVTEQPSITVSIQLNYILEEAVELPSEMPSHDLDEIQTRQFSNFSLPVGSEADPLREFHLTVAWPNLKEEIINETEFYSDLDPHGAPRWYVSASFIPTEMFLHGTLKRILELLNDPKAMSKVDYYLGKISDQSPERAFGALTKSYAVNPTQMNFITNPTGIGPQASVNMPLSGEDLKSCIKFVFERSTGSMDEENFELLTTLEGPATFEDGYKSMIQKCEDILRQAKSSPKGSLTDRIAIVLAKCFIADNGLYEITALCQVWEAICKQLRSYWENNEYLPGLDETAPPDYSKCRLHQKLQMLQACIDNRRKRHKLYDENQSFIGYEEDEFYDAEEEFISDDEDEKAKRVKIAASMDATREPIGRLHALNDIKLLNFPERLIYVPVTQDRSPMTEDMLEEHIEYLATLEEGEAKVQAQVDTLKSDMQAFKAANPGCCLEDFIRWHSPRDWIPNEDGSGGKLSERMTMPNIWTETWESTLARPVIHQDRLFNEVKEAEQILHYFAQIQILELIQLVLPSVFTSATRRLIEEGFECYVLVEEKMNRLCEKVVKTCKNASSKNLDDFLDTLREILVIEKTLGNYLAIRSRFTARTPIDEPSKSHLPTAASTDLRDFCLDLLKKQLATPIIGPKIPDSTEPIRVMDAPNGPLAMAIRFLFNSDARLVEERSTSRSDRLENKQMKSVLKFPPPSRKHYVLRWMVPRKGAGSRLNPQRMYVLVGEDPQEFRLFTSIGSDVTFY